MVKKHEIVSKELPVCKIENGYSGMSMCEKDLMSDRPFARENPLIRGLSTACYKHSWFRKLCCREKPRTCCIEIFQLFAICHGNNAVFRGSFEHHSVNQSKSASLIVSRYLAFRSHHEGFSKEFDDPIPRIKMKHDSKAILLFCSKEYNLTVMHHSHEIGFQENRINELNTLDFSKPLHIFLYLKCQVGYKPKQHQFKIKTMCKTYHFTYHHSSISIFFRIKNSFNNNSYFKEVFDPIPRIKMKVSMKYDASLHPLKNVLSINYAIRNYKQRTSLFFLRMKIALSIPYLSEDEKNLSLLLLSNQAMKDVSNYPLNLRKILIRFGDFFSNNLNRASNVTTTSNFERREATIDEPTDNLKFSIKFEMWTWINSAANSAMKTLLILTLPLVSSTNKFHGNRSNQECSTSYACIDASALHNEKTKIFDFIKYS